jgi:putative acyl-CoA dehydrogenase
LLGEEGKGVKMISKMLTVTRLYNSATAVGVMRRGIALVRDYSDRRIIGRHKLADLPLHLRVLSDLDVIHRGNLIFYLKISELFSKEHAEKINEDEANILRVMTPLLKLFTGKQVLKVVSECL